MKRFFLRTDSSNENYDADIAVAYVEIGLELAALILKRQALFSVVLEADPQAIDVRYWDYSVSYLKNEAIDAALLGDGDATWGQVCDAEVLETELQFTPEQRERTECDQMLVDLNGVRWKTIPKHTDIYISTAEIGTDIIREIAAQADVEKEVRS